MQCGFIITSYIILGRIEILLKILETHHGLGTLDPCSNSDILALTSK